MFKYEIKGKKIGFMGGYQYLFEFDNGYGASVIKGPGTYGYEEGLYELAVLKSDGEGQSYICYDTGITSDVIGYLSVEDVNNLLDKISELKGER